VVVGVEPRVVFVAQLAFDGVWKSAGDDEFHKRLPS
jgi:hypothetical protein